MADSQLAIKGGYEDTGDSNVVGIFDTSHGALCSGSLLAPNMVLTARHCVSRLYDEAGGGGVICSQTYAGDAYNAGGFVVTTKPQMTQNPDDYYTVSKVVVIPDGDVICGNDQAILILSSNIPDTEAKPLVPRVDSALAAQEGYYAIGYGVTSDNANNSGVRRRRDDLFVYCAETGCTGVSQFMTETEWLGDTGICSGDSGGPAIDLQGRVVGVTSRGGADCSTPIYGSVHAWGEWIKTTALEAAQAGGYDAALWATGFPTDASYNGQVGGDCVENACSLCWQNECTRNCGDNAPCPEGYECDEVQAGTNVCVALPPPPAADGGGAGDGATDGGSDDGGCSASPVRPRDPTNPVPWFLGVGALALVALRRRR